MKAPASFFPAFAIALAGVATAAVAATSTEHESHHPDGAPAAVVQIAPAKPDQTAQAQQGMEKKPGMDGPMSGMSGMPDMQKQRSAMREMHDKMMAAKTPAERQALMDEHMKVMRDGMAMMQQMNPGAMQGMQQKPQDKADESAPMAGKPGAMMPGSPQDPAGHQAMLEQRMDMMQSMMQMMMDRMSSMPMAK